MPSDEEKELTEEQIESLKRLMNYMTPDSEVCGTCCRASWRGDSLWCEKTRDIGLPAIPVEEQAVCEHYRQKVG